VTKILKASSGVLFGRKTAGVGKAEELTPSDVRTLLSVYTASQTDTAISAAVNSLVAGAPGLLDTLDELSAALGDDANFASTVTTALAGKVDSSSLNESIDDRVAALLVAGTNITLTYNDASGTLTVASTAGGLSGTGATDNAALRADGTGGSTLQNSNLLIGDLLTASPNNTVNHICLEATGGTTNVSVSVKPKGSGAFCLSAPDGTTTGGNVRGANAIDLCSTRAAASAVASGERSVVLGAGTASGQNSTAIQGGTASGTGSVIFGAGTASGMSSFVAAMTSGIVSGNQAVAFCRDGGTQSGTRSFSHGEIPGYGSGDVTGWNAVGFSGASATQSSAFAQGYYAAATRYGQKTFANGSFAGAFGEAQRSMFIARRKTTDATPLTLMLDGSSSRLTIPSGRMLFATVLVCGIKSDGSAAACYIRKVAIKNVGGTTALIGSVETIGTDIEDNASTNVAITADDTNDALQIDVTGITSETWRWVSVVEGLEVAYGT